MFEYHGPRNEGDIRQSLRTAYSNRDNKTHILFDGTPIGTMSAVSADGGRTAYTSRIEEGGFSIHLQARSTSSLLRKVSIEIARQLRTRDILSVKADVLAGQ